MMHLYELKYLPLLHLSHTDFLAVDKDFRWKFAVKTCENIASVNMSKVCSAIFIYTEY